MFNPQRFVSLWDMYKVYAEDFVHAMEYFGRISRLFRFNDTEDAIAPQDVKDNFKIYISKIEPFLSGFRVPATMAAIRDIKPMLDDNELTERDLGHASEQVFERFSAELGSQWLLILEHDHSAYLNDEASPFGEAVRDRFPLVAEDADEAAKCLALSRYTASVFHLMRVMETTVHVLAKKMKVSVVLQTASWNEITTAMSNSLNGMPAKSAYHKRRKKSLGEVIANLHAVRIAWRNEVMHPKKTYTRKEAERIFAAVEGFIIALVEMK